MRPAKGAIPCCEGRAAPIIAGAAGCSDYPSQDLSFSSTGPLSPLFAQGSAAPARIYMFVSFFSGTFDAPARILVC
jgi:hypothetical protein